MSSLSPRGIASCSISVTNPYLYSRVARSWMTSVEVLIGDHVVAVDWTAAVIALNDTPQPHVLFACGLLKMKPLLSRLVS